MDEMSRVKNILNYKLVFFKIKVRTVLLWLLMGIVLTPIVVSYDDQELYCIAVSDDKGICAYISDGYDYVPTLCVSQTDGTDLFVYKLSSEETAGGSSLVWFENECVCVYSVRTKLIITFNFNGNIVSKETVSGFEYPKRYGGFHKKQSVYSYYTENGVFEYRNVDFWNSFVLRKPRILAFIGADGTETTIWQGKE